MKTATVTLTIQVRHSLTQEQLEEAKSNALEAASKALAGYQPPTGGGYLTFPHQA
jgi:hypothetical protein